MRPTANCDAPHNACSQHTQHTPQVLALYVKLGALFVKQVAKPMASQLKASAVRHPLLAQYLTALGQFMHVRNARMTAALKAEGELPSSGRKVRKRARSESAPKI